MSEKWLALRVKRTGDFFYLHPDEATLKRYLQIVETGTICLALILLAGQLPLSVAIFIILGIDILSRGE